jgi:hypothetical protein
MPTIAAFTRIHTVELAMVIPHNLSVSYIRNSLVFFDFRRQHGKVQGTAR